MSETSRGHIKFVAREKGYGFLIDRENARELFFHCMACRTPFDNLLEGEAVRYELGVNARDNRQRAVNVERE